MLRPYQRWWMEALVLVPAVYLAALVLYAMLGRLDHPFDLEWMEGGMLAHAWRIERWLPIYTEPDADWIPYIYPPGYPAVVAALAQVFGLSMGLGRAVSVVSTLAACAALVTAGHQHGRNGLLGLVAALLYLACYPSTGAFYDLVRPDALALALFAWSVVLCLGGPRARVVAGVLLAAAFTVKHNYAAYGVALAVGIAAQHGWRQGLRFGLAAAAPALGFVAVMQWTTEGHFLTTLIGVPGAHPMVATRFFPGGVEELGRHMGFVLAGVSVTLVALTARLTQRRGFVWGLAGAGAVLTLAIGLQVEGDKNLPDPVWWVEWEAWLALGAGAGAVVAGFVPRGRWFGSPDPRWVLGVGVAVTAFFTAGLMRAHHGGFLNVWMPLHWVLCLAVVIGGSALRARFRAPVEGVLMLAVLAQLVALSDFEPQRYRPQPQDRAAGEAFVELLQQCEGPILSPYAAWLPALAGKEPSWHLIALWDLQHPSGPYRASVGRIRDAAAAKHWACVVTSTGQPFGFGVPEAYELWETPRVTRPGPGWIGPPPLVPKTGWRVRPKSILIPR